MGIKITYTDTKTNAILRETTLTDDETKAMEYNMYSLLDWIDNAFQNKARQCVDFVCEVALKDETHTILPLIDKQSIATQVGLMTTVKQLPTAVKLGIVNKAIIKSVKTRQNAMNAVVVK